VKRVLAVVLLALTLGACKHPAPEAPASPLALIEHTPKEGALGALLRTDAAQASAQGKKPYAYLSATWCAPCQALKHSFSDPRLVAALSGVYLIKLDVDAWAHALPQVGLDVKEIPAFVELDSSGRPTAHRIDGGAWDDDTVESMAPVLARFFKRQN
jgi:hypothetical protein